MRSSPSTPADRSAERALSILLVGTQMALGGAQRLLLDQARWFHAHGHRVSAAFLYDKQGLEQEWSHGLGFPLLTLSRMGASRSLFKKVGGLVMGLFRLWGLLWRGKFDIVESFTYDSNLLALPLAWLAGVPVRIATHHGIIEGFPRLVERLHAGLVNAGVASILVNVSRKVLEQAAAAGIRRERMTVIPNGIPSSDAGAGNGPAMRAELGIDEEDVLILSVGRLVYQKGHEYLIEAMHSILPDFPRAKAVICGEGPLRRQLEAQIDRLGVAASVTLPGNRMDIDRFLRSANIFVLPSRWEGLPVALLEAMDSGLPVVATRVEGVEEVIQNSAQGLLVPPEDARALAESLKGLIADPELRERMGTGARARMRESYTIDIMCEKYLSLMRNLRHRR
ncbi:MAG: glycosyltransferase family 4 protein [Chloroflexota bacterium]